MPEVRKVYDLHERTLNLSKRIIEFAAHLPKSNILNPLVTQLVRAGTSVGANYREADCAESKKDFAHKLGICSKEAKETEYWLEMIGCALPAESNTCETLKKEAEELRRIFIAIINKSRDNK